MALWKDEEGLTYRVVAGQAQETVKSQTVQRFAQAIFIFWYVAADAGSISQQAYLKASNTGSCDEFGYPVAVSGDTVVVGAHYEDSNATGVNGAGIDPLPFFDSGAAYVFVRNGTNWTQQAYLKASNTKEGDFFGRSVAVSGNTVVVGAIYESSNATGVNGDQNNTNATHSGAAYVFVRNGTNWTQQAYLKASNTEAHDWFGYSVGVSGDTVVVGGQDDSNATGVNGNQTNNSAIRAGAAYVFVRSGTNWSQQAYLKASNTGAVDLFGRSVAVSGDTVVVGAANEGSNATGVNGNGANNNAENSGAAYVFTRTGTNWSQQAYLKASNTEGGFPYYPYGDNFGWSVAISPDTIVIGAIGEASLATGVNGDQTDNSGFNVGAAYVFVRNGTNWTQQAYLKASNTEPYDVNGAGDVFGYSVGLSGDTIIVGAPGEDSNAVGINGNQADNGALAAGASYVFVRSGTNWTQQAYVKASNTAPDWAGLGDEFGYSVAISGDTAIVGANLEDSNATGVNGNQSNNSIDFNAGAAYVFNGLGLGMKLSIVPDGVGGYFIRYNGVPDFTYRLQHASDVSSSWSPIATNTAPMSTLIEYHLTNPPPGRAFYRTTYP